MRNLLITIIFILTNFSIFGQITARIQIDRTDSTYCLGDTVRFTNASQGNYVTSHWFFGDGTDTWTPNPFHIYQSADTFRVMLIIADNSGNQDTATQRIIVNPSPQLRLINNEQNQTLIARVIDPQHTTFVWFYNQTRTSQTDSIFYYYDSGTYSVTATNNYGCKDSASIDVTVNQYPQNNQNDTLSIIVVNNILTPNNDGVNDVLYIQNLSEYTNPCQVLIYNKYGVLVYRNDNYTNADGFKGLDNHGRQLPAGTYYYIIKSYGKKTATGFIDLIR